MYILGLNVGSHDTSAALLKDGELLICVSEERLNREKHTKAFPWLSIEACLREASISIADIDAIAFGWDFRRFVRELFLRRALDDLSELKFLFRDAEKLQAFLAFEETLRGRLGYTGIVKPYCHHASHIAFAVHSSGFEAANVMSMDGYGELEATVLASAEGGNVVTHESYVFPNSLGLAYAALTYYLGFKHHCDEGIVMGLASYGDANKTIPGRSETYLEVFERVIETDAEGRYRVNLDWLLLGHEKAGWVSEKFLETFGPVVPQGSKPSAHHMNIAAAIQARLETVALGLARRVYDANPCQQLCLTGGVGLNCVMNTKLLQSGLYEDVYVPAAPGDNGVAPGAAFLAYRDLSGGRAVARSDSRLIGAGPSYSDAECRRAIEEAGYKVHKARELAKVVAQHLARGAIVGWFQGRSEFGPRALGQRSILTRPFPAEMKDILNARVKFREAFRPFAPIVPVERANEYFDMLTDSPFMMHAFDVRPEKREEIAATVHVDGTCRVQTLTKEDNGLLYLLVEEFERVTGTPVLLNTSFNVKGQPIVETPRDAVQTFKSTNIDVLVVGDYLLEK